MCNSGMERRKVKETSETNEHPQNKRELEPNLTLSFVGGLYWIRTSDLMRVKHAL